MSQLWNNGKQKDWINEWQQQYPANIKKISTGNKSELLILDEWMNNQLPMDLKKRNPPYLEHKELSKLLRWKLMRGKFRPRLQKLVESNSPQDIKTISSKSFDSVAAVLQSNELDESKILKNFNNALKLLADLKGVGPATASAILSCFAPSLFPFMSDEALFAVIPIKPLKYDLKTYSKFAEELRKKAKLLSGEEIKEKEQESSLAITPQLLSQCLWSEAIGSMPPPKIFKSQSSKTLLKKRKKS